MKASTNMGKTRMINKPLFHQGMTSNSQRIQLPPYDKFFKAKIININDLEYNLSLVI